MLRFAFPLMLGNLLQQCYNIADTLIVGRVLGADSLAAVGSSYTLIIFITSIFIGLCMGCSAVFSMQYGARDFNEMKRSIFSSMLVVGGVTLLLNIVSLVFISPIIHILQIPPELETMVGEYLFIILLGMIPIALYNFYAFLLRSIGNSIVPLCFLALSVVLNIILDIVFMVYMKWGVRGAAWATVVSQLVAAVGLYLYTRIKFPELALERGDMVFDKSSLKRIVSYSFLTCVQQSVMNFGILMVQGLVNTFGTAVMAAFAIAVKVDSFAYMPVQDFGNAYSVFVSQNRGAGENERIVKGTHSALIVTVAFAIVLSLLVNLFARPLFSLFMDPGEVEIMAIGTGYLRLEGSFYAGIAILFLLYGHFRAAGKPSVSLLLTILSLGTRVLLSYALAPSLGYQMIWISIPVGWALADAAGFIIYRRDRRVTSG